MIEIKDNEHIRRDNAAFMAAYLRAREQLGKLEGVVGVGYGRKEKARAFTTDMAIHVFVQEKKVERALSAEQRIPATFEGYRTDVRIVPRLRQAALCNDETRNPTIQGGIQIQARKKDGTFVGDKGKGTLGCIVKKRGDSGDDNVYLLTCHHVLYDAGESKEMYVYHPSNPPVSDMKSATLVGTVIGGVKREVTFDSAITVPRTLPATGTESVIIPFDAYIDCAIAQLRVGGCCASICNEDQVKFDSTVIDLNPPLTPVTRLNRITDVRNVFGDVNISLPPDAALGTATDANRVYKVGRSTARTVGIVVGVNSSVRDGGLVFRHGVIEVAFDTSSTALRTNCLGRASFAESGDSGSIVVDKDNRAIGILFGGRDVEEPLGSNQYVSYVCAIGPVLDALQVSIVTTGGTSHGSSEATDGSGVALYGPTSRFPETEGKTLFSALDASGASLPRSAPRTERLFPTTETAERMRTAGESLRETPRGRELHEAIMSVRGEIGYLIRSCRPVTVVWHRNRGPAFLAQVLNHVRGDAAVIARDIGGVTRETFLARLSVILAAHGSLSLRQAIERHGPVLMTLADAETIDDVLAVLRTMESADMIA